MVCMVQATPVLEYGRMNIGSRPSKRKPKGGIESLRAIPWIFAWTQIRFHLPVWLGLGAAFKQALKADDIVLTILRKMYNQWPFFRVTVDLVEMVFAKGDPRISALYDRVLVDDELKPIGEELRLRYDETKKLLLQVFTQLYVHKQNQFAFLVILLFISTSLCTPYRCRIFLLIFS